MWYLLIGSLWKSELVLFRQNFIYLIFYLNRYDGSCPFSTYCVSVVCQMRGVQAWVRYYFCLTFTGQQRTQTYMQLSIVAKIEIFTVCFGEHRKEGLTSKELGRGFELGVRRIEGEDCFLQRNKLLWVRYCASVPVSRQVLGPEMRLER